MITLTLPIIGRRSIAEGTVEISLGLGDARFDFVAGQYARITIPHPTYADSGNNSRDFSLVSSPSEKTCLKIAFRISESGFKKGMLEAPLGTQIMVEGPFGFFTLPENHARPIVCIAGGIGITPFLSMATDAAEKKSRADITLLYVNASAESAAYRGVLEELEQKNPRFHLREKIGLLDESFVAENAHECFSSDASCVWYIAGPPGMVQAARRLLSRNGVAEENIYTEEFSNYAD